MTLVGYGTTIKGASSKDIDHFAQIGASQRFQTYSPDFWSAAEGVETEEYDLSMIQDIPVGFFMAEGDQYCTQEQASKFSAEIPSLSAYKVYNSTSYDEFVVYNKDDMVNDMLTFLSDTSAELPLLQ